MISKNDIQCISYVENAHPIHRAWMKEVSSRPIITFIPKSLMFLRIFPALNQIISIISGLFIPSAKIYLTEGPACVPCTFFKRGKVVSINSDTFFFAMKNSKTVKSYSKFLMKRISAFISTSEMMDSEAKRHGKKSEIVYPFMNRKELFKINPNFNNDNICLIAGTRYSKGADILLKVFHEYKKTHPSSELFILGDDKKWIKRINKEGGTAPGKAPIEPYLKKSSIYVNPARFEPFGVNIIEAMAAGIPPIVSEKCGAKDTVKRIDKNLVTSNNAKDILKAIELLKSDKGRYFRLSRKCKEIAKEFSEKQSKKEFSKAFQKIVNNIL